MSDFRLTDEERRLLPGIHDRYLNDHYTRTDAASQALRKKLFIHGLDDCSPCGGTGQVNVDLSTQSSERCEVCGGLGYTPYAVQRRWIREHNRRSLDAMYRQKA